MTETKLQNGTASIMADEILFNIRFFATSSSSLVTASLTATYITERAVKIVE
jgi:hypothetical protein